jgi:hypothetical protein
LLYANEEFGEDMGFATLSVGCRKASFYAVGTRLSMSKGQIQPDWEFASRLVMRDRIPGLLSLC